MARCRRCDSRMIKRRAGVFECRIHGIQGAENGYDLDRSGQPVLSSKPAQFIGPLAEYKVGKIRPTLAPAKGAV